MTRSRLRAVRTLSAAVAAGVITMAVLSPTSGTARAGAATAPVVFGQLNGEGAWSVFEQLVPWQNELSTAPSSVDLNYTSRGSFFGRQDLIESLGTAETDPGHVDFAISGVGFTPDELAKVKGGSSAFISAPVQVATLATLVEPPHGGFDSQTIRCNPDDPSTWPKDVTDPALQCVVTTPMTGPIRIPSRNLAAMFLHYQGPEFPALLAWNNPDVLAALGLQSTDSVQRSVATFSPNAGPAFAGRSDPDEVNYYMQQFVATAAPDVWTGIKNQPPIKAWDPITERLPQVSGVTRDGAEQQVDQLGQDGCGVDGACSAGVAGGVAPAAPSMLKSIHSAFPEQTIDLAQLQNGNGDWVAPTPASIDKAVDAGNDSPLYALTNKVPGAYPLVWVDRLYAPAHGLSVDKTESLATLIRYLATTGQEQEAPNGEGRLSAPLVAQALDAANQLVMSNCVGPDRTISVSTDPGPLVPPTATAMRAIGNMLHCGASVRATTTTSAPTTTSTMPTTATTVPASVDTSGSAGFSSPPPDSVSAPIAATRSPAATIVTVPVTAGSGSTLPTRRLDTGLLTALKLPLPAPAGGGSSDRLATFLLGAALYLLVRKPLARLARRVAS